MRAALNSMWVGRSHFCFPTEIRIFPFIRNVPTGPGAQPASCLKDSSGFLLAGLVARLVATHFPSSAYVRNEWSYAAAPPIVCLEGVEKC